MNVLMDALCSSALLRKPLFSLCLLMALLVYSTAGSLLASDVSVHTKQEGQKVLFFLNSSFLVPATVDVSFISLINMEADRTLPVKVVIEPDVIDLHILTLSRKNPYKASSFEYELKYSPGDSLNAKHDDTVLYYLPYEHGTKQFVDQGYHGTFSHNTKGYEYALDFGLDEGEAICAARGGRVTEVIDSFALGGPHPRFLDKGNYITIFHSDGSYATYAHLIQHGSIVAVGDDVKAGQVIGYAGETGYARGPHLHFSVSLRKPDGNSGTIPVSFLSKTGVGFVPQQGVAYYSFHRGKGDFEETLGQDLTNDSFRDYRKSVPFDGKVEARSETIDRTFVYYVKNGMKKATNIEFHFYNPRGLNPSRKLPVKMTVPPLTEKFLVIVRPDVTSDETGRQFVGRLKYSYEK